MLSKLLEYNYQRWHLVISFVAFQRYGVMGGGEGVTSVKSSKLYQKRHAT